MMIQDRTREPRHGFARLAAAMLPLLIVLGCSSAQSGHAPGVAGGETLTAGITNYPLAYVKRPVPAAPNADIDVRDLITSITGSDLYVRSQASAGRRRSQRHPVHHQRPGAVRDLDVSPDGTKLVFSLRMPLLPNVPNTDPTQPNWHVYQYDAATQTVTQLTNDDITAGHDVGAHYLPDGRIVFASTRQLATQAILLNEGRPQYQAVTDNRRQAIFLLHVMTPTAPACTRSASIPATTSPRRCCRTVRSCSRAGKSPTGRTRSVSTGAIRTAPDCSSSTAPTATPRAQTSRAPTTTSSNS